MIKLPVVARRSGSNNIVSGESSVYYIPDSDFLAVQTITFILRFKNRFKRGCNMNFDSISINFRIGVVESGLDTLNTVQLDNKRTWESGVIKDGLPWPTEYIISTLQKKSDSKLDERWSGRTLNFTSEIRSDDRPFGCGLTRRWDCMLPTRRVVKSLVRRVFDRVQGVHS